MMERFVFLWSLIVHTATVVQGQAGAPFTTLCGPGQHVGKWDEFVPWSELPGVRCSRYENMIVQGLMPLESREVAIPIVLEHCGCVDGMAPENPVCFVCGSAESGIVGEMNAEVQLPFFFDGCQGIEGFARDRFFSAQECENEVKTAIQNSCTCGVAIPSPPVGSKTEAPVDAQAPVITMAPTTMAPTMTTPAKVPVENATTPVRTTVNGTTNQTTAMPSVFPTFAPTAVYGTTNLTTIMPTVGPTMSPTAFNGTYFTVPTLSPTFMNVTTNQTTVMPTIGPTFSPSEKSPDVGQSSATTLAMMAFLPLQFMVLGIFY